MSARLVISRYKSAVCNNVFVGIQPLFKQVPPSSDFSIKAVFNPCLAAKTAASYPAGPAPIIAN